MGYKFERLEVWQLALEYADMAYALAEKLPSNERFSLSTQLTRAANSIALNIAEGSTGLSNKEQARFLGMAIRTLMETVACLHLINRRHYLDNNKSLRDTYSKSRQLFIKLQAFRNHLQSNPSYLKENQLEYAGYEENETIPF